MYFAYRKWLFILPVAATVFTLIVQFIPLFKVLELGYDDLLITQPVATFQPPSDIIILTITEDTLANFAYRSPIDRGYLAKIVTKLTRAKARSVGVDILFDQATEPNKDQALKLAFKNASDMLVVASANKEDGLSQPQLAFQAEFLAGINTASILLAKNGYDGIVRHALLSPIHDGQLVLNLAQKMSGKLSDGSPRELNRIYYQANEIGEPQLYPTYPAEAAEVLPDEWFEGKYVLIGMDVSGIDQFRTPFVNSTDEATGTLPGISIHAHILNQHLRNLEVSKLSVFGSILVMYAAALVAVAYMLTEISIFYRVMTTVTAIGVVLTVPYLLFPHTHVLVPALSIGTSIFISMLSVVLVRWRDEQRQRNFVTNAWSRYVSPGVVDELIANPTRLETSGEHRDVSLIFTDIENFTSLVERTSIDRVAPVLNRYLDRMSAEFLNAGATLDKFVGDAVVGFFGAPVDDEFHPDKAVALALRLDEVCREFQKELLDEGIELGSTRIGVHSGTAVVGNFGGAKFFDYTAIGDTVNTAARLESANKVWGGNICVSGETSSRAIAHSFRPIGRLCLAGKLNPIDAFEPWVSNNEKIAPREDYQSAYQSLEQNNQNAIKLFKELKKTYPEDHLVSFYLARIKNGDRETTIETSK